MRILFVAPHYRPAWRYGGPIRSVHGLAAALAARGHDVHVFTTDADGPARLDVPLATLVDIDDVKVRYFPTGLGRRLYRSPAMAAALAKEIAGFDIVHTHSAWVWPTSAAAAAARRAGVPYVYATRGMLVADLIARKSRLVKAMWLALFERRNIARAAAIHVTTAAEARQLDAMALDHPRVVVLANGVDQPPAPDSGTPVLPWMHGDFLLFLGRVSWEKGLDRFIPALAHAPGARLVIAGEAEPGYRKALEDIATAHGVAGRVIFAGPIAGALKWAALRAAAALVLPSLSENFGVAAAEALAVATPVILSEEVGIADAVSAAGAGLVAAGTPEAMGAAVAAMLADPDSRRAMGMAGAALATRSFAWPAIAADTEALYAKILSRGE